MAIIDIGSKTGTTGAAMSKATLSLAALASPLFSQVPDLSPTPQHQ